MRCVLCWCPVVPCSYGRGGERGTARPEVLQELLKTTDRVVQAREQGGLLWWMRVALELAAARPAGRGPRKRSDAAMRGELLLGAATLAGYTQPGLVAM